MPDGFIQRHFANLRHIRDVFRIDPRAERGTGQIAPWLSGIVQLVHPAFPGSFAFHDPEVRSFANPAVAANFLITIPPNEAWAIRAVRFRLTTDVNVADRIVLLQLDDSVNRFMVIPAVSVQPAGETKGYSYGRATGYPAELGDHKLHGLPEVIMDTGWKIASSIVNIQVGDQIEQLTVLVDIFPRA